MNPLDMPLSDRQFFTRQEALASGYGSRDITAMVRRKQWTRVRRGAYAETSIWEGAGSEAQHRIRALAVLASLGPDVALSHGSAVAFHGIDHWGADLSRVHVTRLDGDAGRKEGDVVHHEGFTLTSEITETAGVPTVAPARAVLEAGSRLSPEAALAMMDSGLRLGRYTFDDLKATYEVMQHWPFSHRLVVPLTLADPRTGSVGESRARWRFHLWNLPTPELQYEVRRPDGTVAGITDWAWPHRKVLAEFDGKIKYNRLLKPGQTAGDAVFAEKRREDELRELTGFTVVRMVWDDFRSDSTLQARLRAALRMNA